MPRRPKFDAVVYFLEVCRWLELDCIIFGQYFKRASNTKATGSDARLTLL